MTGTAARRRVRKPWPRAAAATRLVLALTLSGAAGCDALRRSDPGLDTPSCATCRIDVTPVLQLDFTNAPFLPDLSARLALDANHETFAVLTGDSPTAFLVFDADGRLVRVVGTGGDGPGEYGRIDGLVFDATDSLWVFDGGNGRADVYGPDLERARSVSLDGLFRDVIALEDGNFAVLGGGATVEGLPYQMRLLRRSGEIVPFAPAGSDRALGGAGAIRSAGRSAVWLAAVHSYAIERWSTAGTLQLEIQRAPPWFARPDAERTARFAESIDVRPAILDVLEDAERRLWVIGGVLDPRAPDPATAAGRTDVNIDGTFDTVIEILDPESMTLVTSARFDFAPPVWLRDGLLYRFVIDMMGTPGIEIARATLFEF